MTAAPATAATNFVYDAYVTPGTLPAVIPSSPWHAVGSANDQQIAAGNLLTINATNDSTAGYYYWAISGSAGTVQSTDQYQIRSRLRVPSSGGPSGRAFYQAYIGDGTRMVGLGLTNAGSNGCAIFLTSLWGYALSTPHIAAASESGFFNIHLIKEGTTGGSADRVRLYVDGDEVANLAYSSMDAYNYPELLFGAAAGAPYGTIELTGASFGINEPAPLLYPDSSDPAPGSKFVYNILLTNSLPQSPPWTTYGGSGPDIQSADTKWLTLVDAESSNPGYYYMNTLSASQLSSTNEYQARTRVQLIDYASSMDERGLYQIYFEDGSRMVALGMTLGAGNTTRFFFLDYLGRPLQSAYTANGTSFYDVVITKTGRTGTSSDTVTMTVNGSNVLSYAYTTLPASSYRDVIFGVAGSPLIGIARVVGATFGIDRPAPLIAYPMGALAKVAGQDGGGVTNDFWIGVNEVRVSDYVKYLNQAENSGEITLSNGEVRRVSDSKLYCLTHTANPGACVLYASQASVGYRFTAALGKYSHPITYVSWFGAAAYCNWKSTQAGRTPVYDPANGWTSNIATNGYRLPTEAEWYKAAAWNKDLNAFKVYGTGADILAASDVNYLNSGDASETNSLRTTAVASYMTLSPSGLFDASGNVWEWCHGFYDLSGSNPAAHAHALRGGAWGNLKEQVTTTSRIDNKPDAVRNSVGFRIATSVSP